MSLVLLDKKGHEYLKKQGFLYFLILDLQFSDDNKLTCIVVKAVKQIPAVMPVSCTGIDDAMIAGFIYNTGLNCEVYLQDEGEGSLP